MTNEERGTRQIEVSIPLLEYFLGGGTYETSLPEDVQVEDVAIGLSDLVDSASELVVLVSSTEWDMVDDGNTIPSIDVEVSESGPEPEPEPNTPPATVYALLAYDSHEERADNTLRVFTDESDAEKWAVLLEAAQNDARFPVTYAELSQEFDWVPDWKHDAYSVVEHTVHESGWHDD